VNRSSRAGEWIFRRIVEQATDLIYVLDLDLRVVWLNRHAMQVFTELLRPESSPHVSGEASDDDRLGFFVGRQIDELFRPTDVEFLRKKRDDLLTRQDSLVYEHSFRSGDRLRHFSTKLVPIRDDDGVVFQVAGITRDVTDRHEFERRIYQAEKLASIGVLAAGLAHEMGNPLAVILGFTDLLKERFGDGSRERADLDIIEQSARDAQRVVENMLGFARVTEGQRTRTDVVACIESVVGVIRHAVTLRGVEIRVETTRPLPEVRGDPREFQQVLINLANNAVAAMQGRKGILTFRARRDGDRVRVEVRDTGRGIPEAIRDRVFDPFFTTKQVGEGTGLGLSLCCGIIDKIGGKISVSSVSEEDQPGQAGGTVFELTLPVASGPMLRRNG